MSSSAAKKRKKRGVVALPPPLPLPIVDNHTHIYPDPAEPFPIQKFNDDAALRMPVLLANMRGGMAAAGVRAAISSGCELPMLEFTVELARNCPELWGALAIHPNEVPLHAGVREIGPDGLVPNIAPHHEVPLDEALAQVAELAADSAVVAIGETGLDYFRTGDAGKEIQQQAFRAHIALAKELGKPLQMHIRGAVGDDSVYRDVVEILLADGAPKQTVFHCYSGDQELAEICNAQGWYASFAGNVTFPANAQLRAAFLTLHPELVLVETDAPYLTPLPFRGHPNAVWGAVYTAKYLAQLAKYRVEPVAAEDAAAETLPESELIAWLTQLDANVSRVYGV
ncbi:MAG: TatD family hydrolase [Trueperella sp.]|nr:TatD family hydrolase [Trueperella sp.]